MFLSREENYFWRQFIANWVDLIKVGADQGEDKPYKTVFKTIGRQLYTCGLPQTQRSIVEHASEIRKIN